MPLSLIALWPCMHGSRGGPDPPLLHRTKNYKAIGFLSNTTLDPLNITKLPANINVRPSSALKWSFSGGPIFARFQWYLDPLSPHQLKNIKNKQKKRQSWSPLTTFSGSVHTVKPVLNSHSKDDQLNRLARLNIA